MRATDAAAADITLLPALLHGQEREVFGDQAYWKEAVCLWSAAGARKLVLEDDACEGDADLVVSTLVSQFRGEA